MNKENNFSQGSKFWASLGYFQSKDLVMTLPIIRSRNRQLVRLDRIKNIGIC
jgi:hypothetical protein